MVIYKCKRCLYAALTRKNIREHVRKIHHVRGRISSEDITDTYTRGNSPFKDSYQKIYN
jgi:hypothetical protein